MLEPLETSTPYVVCARVTDGILELEWEVEVLYVDPDTNYQEIHKERWVTEQNNEQEILFG
jgi:hypothetical protein